MTHKIALVTGAGTGVGSAASLALMKIGFTVVLAGRRLELLQETQKLGEAEGGQSLPVTADMADPTSIAVLFAKIRDTYGRLDLLFNNAGMGAPAVPFEDLGFAHWQAVVNTNLTGPFLCTQHHQQRLDLRACAATVVGGLHLDQARHHRPHQGHQPRRPRL
jgi:NAD(P)-dependent dehydrogenase (short-subunit alcohol dehydrogenase family)